MREPSGEAITVIMVERGQQNQGLVGDGGGVDK